ncbi:hypothetical protein PV04_04580 [Phialophora macrospora]|uniref:Uncharacterized protein n=1 Tax=Phialophora macrospora TaxID=1851006 RepID=A0A0D2E2T8_9EURO|nr:hypothetical protein PV04_04580 [Phialophora macrospora]
MAGITSPIILLPTARCLPPRKLRTIVADLFRGMMVTRNPSLFQCLPAEKEHELDTSPRFVLMKAELADLKRNLLRKNRIAAATRSMERHGKYGHKNSAAYKKPSPLNVRGKPIMNFNPSVSTVPASLAFVD